MKKKYYIIIFVMILFGLFLPRGIMIAKKISIERESIANKVNSFKKEYAKEINNLNKEKLLPKYIQDILDKILLHT